MNSRVVDLTETLCYPIAAYAEWCDNLGGWNISLRDGDDRFACATWCRKESEIEETALRAARGLLGQI